MAKFIVCLFVLACISSLCKSVFAVESHAVVLMYHRFGEDKFPTTSIKTEQFIQQLDFFIENGFEVWPLPKIIEHLQNKIPIPDKTMAITIDDAYLSVYQIAYPLMYHRNIPFTLFVSSGVVDKSYSSYMDWDQIKDMAEHGVTLGNHTVNHLHLVQHIDKVLPEISFNQKRIEEMTGVKTKLFAYPYGEYNLELARQIKSLNYIGFGQHSGPIGENSDFRFLPRFPMSEQYADIDELRDKLFSLPMPISDIKPKETVTVLSRPLMVITLDTSLQGKKAVSCFVSAQGVANIEWVSDFRFTVQANKPINIRRSRYNCTIKDRDSGRYFWFSHMWLQPQIAEP